MTIMQAMHTLHTDLDSGTPAAPAPDARLPRGAEPAANIAAADAPATRRRRTAPAVPEATARTRTPRKTAKDYHDDGERLGHVSGWRKGVLHGLLYGVPLGMLTMWALLQIGRLLG